MTPVPEFNLRPRKMAITAIRRRCIESSSPRPSMAALRKGL